MWQKAKELHPAWWWIIAAGIFYELAGTIPGWMKSDESGLVLAQVMAAKFAYLLTFVVPLTLAVWAWDRVLCKWTRRWGAWVAVIVLWIAVSLILSLGFSLVPGVGGYYSGMTFHYSDADPR